MPLWPAPESKPEGSNQPLRTASLGLLRRYLRVDLFLQQFPVVFSPSLPEHTHPLLIFPPVRVGLRETSEIFVYPINGMSRSFGTLSTTG